MVGDGGRRLRGLDRAPHDRVGGPPRAPARGPGNAPSHTPVTGGETVGQPLRVQHLGLDDLRQRDLSDQDFLPAVGVEGAGLGQFVLVGGWQRQTVTVGEDPSRVVVHVASPALRSVGSVRPAGRSGFVRSASIHDTCRRRLAERGCHI
ncbi:hypothetical protein GCM10023238_18700 [Streptomyces heliomycini]